MKKLMIYRKVKKIITDKKHLYTILNMFLYKVLEVYTEKCF